MKQNKTLTKADLIRGNFDPEEAKEIIFALFTSKINFHSLQAFAIEERTGVCPTHHTRRVQELNADLKILREAIAYAQKKKLRLRIKGEVILEYVGTDEKNEGAL